MIWGAFSFHDRTPLNVIDGNLTGDRYLQEIIRPLVLPTLQRIGVGAVFQDDNVRSHRARVVMDFLRLNNVKRIDLPAYSPDLSPIEHAWDELGRRARSNHAPPNNCAQLVQMFVAGNTAELLP